MKLIGYLEEGPESILVVEYVPNGTLGSHLDGTHKNTLDMSTRLDIAIDIAHALTYLHLYADRPIIHRDIKSSKHVKMFLSADGATSRNTRTFGANHSYEPGARVQISQILNHLCYDVAINNTYFERA